MRIKKQNEHVKDYIKILEQTSTREVEANEKLETYQTEQETYQKELQEKEEIIKRYIEQDEKGLTPTNYRTILGMLHRF